MSKNLFNPPQPSGLTRKTALALLGLSSFLPAPAPPARASDRTRRQTGRPCWLRLPTLAATAIRVVADYQNQ